MLIIYNNYIYNINYYFIFNENRFNKSIRFILYFSNSNLEYKLEK